MEEEKEYSCTIPRNLNKPDTIAITNRIEVSLKQIAYVASGGVLCWYGFQLELPIIAKAAVSTVGLEAGLLLAFGQHKGVNMDQLAIDGVTYLSRNAYYKRLEKGGDLVVTIKAKEEESTVITKSKRFSIQPSRQ